MPTDDQPTQDAARPEHPGLAFYRRWSDLSPENILSQGPERIYGEGYHPVPAWLQATLEWEAVRQGRGEAPRPEFGDLNTYVERQLGYLPSYWEDPHRVGKWKHKLDSLPEGAPVPAWINRDKLNAAYKYFESRNDGQPWWNWKFLHPTDSARGFLQGFDVPPPEALYPEDQLYTPGQVADQPSAGPPLPGSAEWDALDAWQKVQVAIFGQGPELGDYYNIPQPAVTFGRGFLKSAATGAGIGFFTAGGPFNPIASIPAALAGGAITGLIGAFSELTLAEIEKNKQQGIVGAADPALEVLLRDVVLGSLQYPAEQLERLVGTGQQLRLASVDPDRYGPVSEVLGNLRLFEFGAGQQGLVPFLPYLGGPTGRAAGLFYETPSGVQRSITNGLDWLSKEITDLAYGEGTETYQSTKPDEIWDLGGTAPRKIGPNTPETAAAVAAWAITTIRRELMTTNLAPRDAVLAIGQQFGISGILSDLVMQSVLDPYNVAPTAQFRTLRGAARGKGLGGILSNLVSVGADERAALAHAITMVESKRIGADEIRGLRSASGFVRGQLQTGGVEVLRTFANILRTNPDLGKIEKVAGMTTFARWLGGVTPEGELKITLEPTGVFGRLFGLTPKARATKFIFTANDVIKTIIGMGETPEQIAKAFLAIGSGNAAEWQKLGIGLLGTPDGHYPVLAMRDFNVSKVKGFMEIWNAHERPRQILGTIAKVFGHEDVRTTVRMLRDYGDASWAKFNEALRIQVGQGNETAIGLVRLIDQRILTKATLDSAVKGSLSGTVPLTVDHFRYMLYDAWLDHLTKWVVSNFNVDIEPMLYRLSNALKQGASLVLLDGNPGYLYANFWNNASTTFIDGHFGFNRIDTIVRYFETEIGMVPGKLEQAFGGPGAIQTDAGLILKADIAKLTLDEAIAKGVEPREWVKAREVKALNVLAEKTTGHGAIASLDRFLGSLRQKPGQTGLGKWSPLVVSRMSAWVERLQGANAFYRGTKSWLTRAWRRGVGLDKLPAGIEAAIGTGLAEKVYGFVEGKLRYDEIEAGLLEEGRINASVHQFVEGVSRALGDQVSPADVLAMLDEADILPVLEAELPKVRNAADLHMTFAAVEDKIRTYINETHVLDLIQKAREVAEAIKIGDLTGLHDTFVDLNARLAEWWTSHVIEWGNVVEEADTLHGEGMGDAANAIYKARLEMAKAEADRIMEMQTAVIDGLVEGLKEVGVDVGPKYALGLRTQIAEWRRFFETRDALWQEYGEQRAADMLPQGRYVEIVNELSGKYQLRIEDDLYLQGVMDAQLVGATARVNLRAANVLDFMLSDIREHKAKLYAEEAAVRDAVFELWNLETGAEAAAVIRRHFAGHPDLLKASEQLTTRWTQRKTPVTNRDLRSFRRQVYDLWSRQVKVKHIRDYYAIRSEGLVEIFSEAATPARPDAEQPEPQQVRPETTGVAPDEAVVAELAASGLDPNEATRIATERATETALGFKYSTDVTIDELRRLARDAGIATSTAEGRGYDGHLVNTLNKDLGLNDTPFKLRRLEDLATIQRAGGTAGDTMRSARQALVNRAVKRLRWQQESKITGLSVEALETLDAGIDAVATTKMRRIAETNGLTEAEFMPKEHIWSWLDSRRKRVRTPPFEQATPEALKIRVSEAMDRAGYPGLEVSDQVIAVFDARAKAIGMTLEDYMAWRMGNEGTAPAIYTFEQAPDVQLVKLYRATDFGRGKGNYWTTSRGEALTRAGHNTARGPSGTIDVTFALPERWAKAQHDAVLNNARRSGDPNLSFDEALAKYGQDQREGFFGDEKLETFALGDEPPETMYGTLYQDAESRRPIYSSMARVVEAKMPERMPADQLLAFLEGAGIKPEEIKWSLLGDLIEQRRGLVDMAGREGAIQEMGAQPIIEKSEVLALAKAFEPLVVDKMYPEQTQPIRISEEGIDAELTWSTDTEQRLVRGVSGEEHIRSAEAVSDLVEGGYEDLGPFTRYGSAPVFERPNEFVEFRIQYVGDRIAFRPVMSEADLRLGSGYRLTMEHTRYPGGRDAMLSEGRSIIASQAIDARRLETAADTQNLAGGAFASMDEAMQAARDWQGYDMHGADTEYGRYTYPGGTNYRELVVHLPSKVEWGKIYEQRILDAMEQYNLSQTVIPITQFELRRPDQPYAVGDMLNLFKDDPETVRSKYPDLARAIETYRAFESVVAPDAYAAGQVTAFRGGYADYHSPHFKKEPNYLAHARLKDRYLPDGRRVLFMEELQSDYGQAARKVRKLQRAFDLGARRKALYDEKALNDTGMGQIVLEAQRAKRANVTTGEIEAYAPERWKALNDEINRINKELGTIEAEIQKFVDEDEGFTIPTSRPPDPIRLPFEKTWHELTLKRLIRLATEEGYDGFMWNDAEGVFVTETGHEFAEAIEGAGARITWLEDPTDTSQGYLWIEDGETGEVQEEGRYSETEARHLVEAAGVVWNDLDIMETYGREGTSERGREAYRQNAELLGLFDRDVSELAKKDWDEQGGPDMFDRFTLETGGYGEVEVFVPDVDQGVYILRPSPGDEGVSMNEAELLKELGYYDPELPEGKLQLTIEDLVASGEVNFGDGDFFDLARVYDEDLSWMGDDPELWMPEEISLYTAQGVGEPEGGGELSRIMGGFREFYDTNLPKTVNKLLKPWKAQVEDTNFLAARAGKSRTAMSGPVEVNGETFTILYDPDQYTTGGWIAGKSETTGFVPVHEMASFEEVKAWAGPAAEPVLTQFLRFINEDEHPGHLVTITDEMRAGTGVEFKLFQETSETNIKRTETVAREKLIDAINAELPPGIRRTQTLVGLLDGKDIREVLRYQGLGEVPEGLMAAWDDWNAAKQDTRWLDAQPRMFQGPKGSVDIGRDGRAIMRWLKGADPSTALHEPAHVFFLDLLQSERETVLNWVKQDVKSFGGADLRRLELHEGRFHGQPESVRQAYEAFARGFERYVAEGIAPTPGLRAVFEKFKAWLLAIYRGIAGSGIDIPLNDAMRQLYGDMLGGRAPDFDTTNITWESIKADAVIDGRPTKVVIPPPALVLPERVSPQPGLIGERTQARGADPNTTYDFRYLITDLDQPRVSHNLSGEANPEYPRSLQPRDRSRAASLRQSQQIAADLNPNVLLEPTGRIDDGPPIIEASGNISSGNGRINGLRLAARDYPANYQAYKSFLLDLARDGTYGPIDQAALNQMAHPVLLRERVGGPEATEFAKLANESAILGMSTIEQAGLDVSRISEAMLETLVVNEGQSIQDALLSMSNRDIVRRFTEQLPRSEQAEALTSDGLPTQRLMDRMLAAMFMFVYGDPGAPTLQLRLAEQIFESTDPVLKNVTGAMIAVAGDMAKAEMLVRTGRRPEQLSLTQDLVAAITELHRIKSDPSINFADYVQQQALPGMTALTPFQSEIMVTLEGQKRSMKAIRELLQGYARAVIAEPETGQMGLLGPHEYPTAEQMWERVKSAPASQSTLFQLPEQMPMRGYFDQAQPIGENSAKSAEGYRNMLGIMDELREQMAGPEGYVQPIRSEEIRGRLAPDQQAEFKKWVKGLKGQLSSTKFSAVKWGEDVRNFSLLDYTALRGIDTNFLGIPFNYAFWPTRQVMRWLLRNAEYPALMANFARLNEARRKQEERPGFPRRLFGKVYIPVPWMPEWMGDGLFIDPIRQFLPPAMMMSSFNRIAIEQNRTAKRAEYILQKWVENGDTHPGDAQAAIQAQSGDLWQMAVDQAKTELQQEFQDPLDYVQLFSGLSLPVSIAHEVLRGTPEKIQPLPLTRYTKMATAAFAQMTGIGNPEGVNLEGPIREAFDLPRYDRFEDYRVDRMLANMAGDDPSIVREALIAGQEKTGPLYDEAVRRVNTARVFGVFANPAWMIFGMGGDTFPTGEQRQRKLGEEFSLAITARELGDSTALNRFFEKYPEYETRLASFDTQEEKMRGFLIDEVWTRYNELGSSNKELVRNQLGVEFEELFLSKETRSYADIPLENLAGWASVLGGYVPANAENRIEIKELPNLLQLPEQYAKVIDDFRAARDEKYPNWFAVQQGYFASGPSRSQDRKDYLAQWPELQDYWDWRDGELEGSEFLAAYYRRYDLENRDTGSLGSLGVAQIVTNPILMRQLTAARYGGQSLTSGALEELRRIYEIMGAPGDFNTWVDGLDPMSMGAPQQTGYGGQATP